jgi:hypothetical protein
MAFATYGHVIEELEGTKKRPAEDIIRSARSRRVPSEFPERVPPTAGALRQSARNVASMSSSDQQELPLR